MFKSHKKWEKTCICQDSLGNAMATNNFKISVT